MEIAAGVYVTKKFKQAKKYYLHGTIFAHVTLVFRCFKEGYYCDMFPEKTVKTDGSDIQITIDSEQELLEKNRLYHFEEVVYMGMLES